MASPTCELPSPEQILRSAIESLHDENMSDRKISRLRPSQRQVECSVCNDTVGEYSSAIVENNIVCRGCIRQIFAPAATHEHHYPARWGASRLEAKDFEHLLGTDFAARYHQKEIEYRTEIQHRVYCICGTFVFGRPRRSNVRTKLPCSSCGKLVCTFCKAMAAATESHRCEEHLRLQAAIQAQAPKKGVDWEVKSPCCGALISRVDGCSEMTCCGRNFCFVCGNPVVHGDGHFQRGGCPRFDQREPVYDDEDDSDSDDDDDDEEEDDDDVSDDLEPFDLANNPRHNRYVDDLARERVQRAIEVGTIVDDNAEIENREWFRIENNDANTEEELDEVQRIMDERIQAMMAVAQEVRLFWRDDGFERPQPITPTPLQEAVMDILNNLRTESRRRLEVLEVPEEFGTALGFEPRHRRAEEAIIFQTFSVGQERMNNEYPRLMEFWRTYLEKLSAQRRITLQSDLGALGDEIDNFFDRTHAQQQRTFANELRAAVVGIWTWRSKLPDLLELTRPSITKTRGFVMVHRRFLRTFERLEEFGFAQSLPLTRAAWRGYLDRFPEGLHEFIERAATDF